MRRFGVLALICIIVVGVIASLPPATSVQTDSPSAAHVSGADGKGSQQSAEMASQSAGPLPSARWLASEFSAIFDKLWKVVSGWTGIAILIALLILYSAGRPTGESYIPKLRPSFFFWLGVIYLGLLLLIAMAYVEHNKSPYLIADILPIAVPWFGALGAVTISLEGVFAWNKQWDVRYNYWHIGRPLFGAVVGIVAFFVYVLLIGASGTQPEFLTKGEAMSKDLIIFYVVAFLVGYREETFRELIKRVTDLIMKSDAKSALSPSVAFASAGATLSVVAFPDTVANQSSTLIVEVKNTGDVPLKAPSAIVKVATPTPPGTFDEVNDHVSGSVEIAPGQTRTVEVRFSPVSRGRFSGQLTVTADNLAGSKSIGIAGTGT